LKKTTLLLLIQIIVYSLASGQPYGPLIFTDTITFETSHGPGLRIDTSQIGGIWHVGTPAKTYFNSAYTAPNAIFTDTGFYTVNNYSYFDIIIKDTFQYYWPLYGEGILGFRHKYDTDTMRDGGFIEISYDGGNTWENIINDTHIIAMNTTNFYSNSDTITGNLPAFSGRSDGWQYAQIYWFWIAAVKDVFQDSLIIRFNFKSDSINNNKEGWLIDQIFFNGYEVTGHINNTENNKEIKVFPIPAKDILNIEFANPENAEYTLNLYDVTGKSLLLINNIRTDRITLNTSDLDNGIYIFKLSGDEKNEFGKIIINKIK